MSSFKVTQIVAYRIIPQTPKLQQLKKKKKKKKQETEPVFGFSFLGYRSGATSYVFGWTLLIQESWKQPFSFLHTFTIIKTYLSKLD